MLPDDRDDRRPAAFVTKFCSLRQPQSRSSTKPTKFLIPVARRRSIRAAESFEDSPDRFEPRSDRAPLCRVNTRDNSLFPSRVSPSSLTPPLQTSERLARAANVVIWNRWFMTVLGLWPTKVNQPLFVFCSVYTVLHCTMGARHLIKYIDRPDYVIANLVENVVFFMMLGKLLVCRRSCGPMAEFLGKIEDDFSAGSYANARERTAYLRYNEYALTFIKYLMGLYGFTAVLFYFKTFLGNWSSSK